MTRVKQMALNFASIKGKKVEATFDGGRLSSDGGLMYLRAVDRAMGLVDRLCCSIADNRHKSYVHHSLSDLLRQRIFQIACGYEDANDCDSLRADPVFKMVCERLPVTGADLASQPTMTRLENRIRRTELYRLACAFVDVFVSSYETVPKAIILDMDDTEDRTHGAQQLSLFNGYYNSSCYLPLHIYEGRSGRLITTILRPGTRPSGARMVAIIKRLVARIRAAWPRVHIILRGDGHFSSALLHDFCDRSRLFYVFGYIGSSRLKALTAPLMDQARTLAADLRRPVRLFHSLSYRAKTWNREKRIIMKAEITSAGPNPRFLVTNLASSQASFIYERIYCARGRMEGFIKNHKNGLASDRTSCHRFPANQFRLFLHSAAYVLLHRLATAGLAETRWCTAQFDTLQKKLLKVGARVMELATRVKIQFPAAYPHKDLYQRLSAAFG